MLNFRQALLTVDGEKHTLQPDKSNSFGNFFVNFDRTDADGTSRYSIFLHPRQDITVNRLELHFDLTLLQGWRLLANGYQSWSETRVLGPNQGIKPLLSPARSRMGHYGDEYIKDIPKGKGYVHSWSYTCIQSELPQHLLLVGSLNEHSGFTLFLYDQAKSVLIVRKDLDGLQLSHSFPALDVIFIKGTEKAVFDQYASLLEIQPPDAPPLMGWTSWYRHFNRITPEILLHNLESFSSVPVNNVQAFQIDDGWQQEVGDWMLPKAEFKGKMGEIAHKIKEKGMMPGIWVAPFVVSKNAEILRKNPDWLLRDRKGQPVRVGWNPMWGGWYFALDFYRQEVRDYLAGVFHLLAEKWGYELFKLDFLFAVAIHPPKGKTRGQVMHEAMEFLRQMLGKKRILACGAPLASCFGIADYCRIGGDVHTKWEHALLATLRHRERVSTVASLRSTLNRWQLNGRFFQNDPDVFILRAEDQNLTPEQQYTLLIINTLLGNICFTSDDLESYSVEQKAELEEAHSLFGSQVEVVQEIETDVWHIQFSRDHQRQNAWCNLTGKRVYVNQEIELLPYESIVSG